MTAAIHEVGHAIVQLAFNLGPDSVTIHECRETWCGHSQMYSNFNPDLYKTRIMVTQLAGPIAQLIYCPASLGEYRSLLEGGILVKCKELSADKYKILEGLMWALDLEEQTAIISKANAVFNVRNVHKGVGWEQGAYLYYAEKSLFAFFEHLKVRSFAEKTAKQLADVHKLDSAEFCKQVKNEISAEISHFINTIELP